MLKTSGPTLLNITSQDLQRWGLDDRSIEKTVLEAVQSLSDPSVTLACASHASFGGPVLLSVTSIGIFHGSPCAERR